MALATWWTTDPLPEIAPLPGLQVTAAVGDAALAELNRIPIAAVRDRRAAGHRAYTGFVDGTPVTYGWVATVAAEIGELGLRFRLPASDRYLWDFATRPAWQGRGLYPRLLRDILVQEAASADRFWIIHAPENTPSGAGMQKAGFTPVGRLSFEATGRVVLMPTGPAERAAAGARVLGVPLGVDPISPCWRCRTETEAPGSACCVPTAAASACACHIERRPSTPRASAPATGDAPRRILRQRERRHDPPAHRR